MVTCYRRKRERIRIAVNADAEISRRHTVAETICSRRIITLCTKRPVTTKTTSHLSCISGDVPKVHCVLPDRCAL